MAGSATSTAVSSGTRRALVVEDEPHIRELVALHLGLEGLSVVEAAAGDEAIRRAEAERFDLVVLDLMLPKVDGVAVCRAIRRQATNADVPILMLTARLDESDKVLGLESGADDYLTKPFGVREFVARSRALLRRTRASALAPGAAGNDIVQAGPSGSIGQGARPCSTARRSSSRLTSSTCSTCSHHIQASSSRVRCSSNESGRTTRT